MKPNAMRVIERWAVCMILVGIAVGIFAGCSPTQREWFDRAQKGVENDAGNDKKLVKLAKDGIEAKEADALRSAGQDMKDALDGKLVDPDTGEVIPLTPEYIDRAVAILQAQLKEIQTDRDELAEAESDNDENRRQIKESIRQAQRLNTIWSNNTDALSKQINDLAEDVQEMNEEKKDE